MVVAVDQVSEALPAAQALRDRLRVAGRLLATLLLPGLLLAYDLIPQPPYGANPITDAWRRQALVALALLSWAVMLALRRRLPRPNSLLAPLLLFLCVEVAATVSAPDPRIGVEPALDLLAAILIFWALAESPGLSATAIRWALMLVALALALVCLHFVWDRWLAWRALAAIAPTAHLSLLPPTVPRAEAGTNPNIAAPLMAFAAPLYLVAILRSPGWRRIALVLAAMVVQAGIFFTLARAAWIGEAAGVVVCGALLLLAGRRTGLPLRRIALACAAALAVLLCPAAVLLARGYRPLWLFRPSFAARTDFRGAALAIVGGHPLLGTGPGSFVLIYPYISNGDPAGAVHAHNVPIQIAVETGLLGLLAAGLVALMAVLILIRAWRNGDSGQRAIVACAAGAGMSFLVNGMADSLQLFPEILFVLGALVAAVLRQEANAAGARLRVRWPARRTAMTVAGLLPFALSAVLLLVWLRIDQAGRDDARSIDLASKQRWPEAVAMARAATALDPTMPVYHVQAALDLGIEAETLAPGDLQAQQRSGTAATGAALRAQALAELNRALALEPRSAAADVDLALLYINGGQTSQALAVLPDVVAGAPRDSMLLLSAGVIEEQSAPATAQATIDDYAAALAQSPRIADSPFWQETAFRRQNFPAIVLAALTRAAGEDSSAGPTATREIILQASGLAPTTTQPGGAPDFTARIQHAEALTAQGDYVQAEAILRRAVSERSDDPAARLALGDLYAAMGETARARREWLTGAYLGDTASIAHLIESWPAGQAPPALLQLGQQALTALWVRQLDSTQQHYRFAYRRQEPYPITLPSDALNGVPKVYWELMGDLLGHSVIPNY